MRLLFFAGILLSSFAHSADCNRILFSHILAVSKNGVIGLNNLLPWSIPKEFEYFLKMTDGKTMIMGRRTFESPGHPFSNRFSIVLTKNRDYQYSHPDVAIMHDLESAIEFCHSRGQCGEEIFIIGGGEIYRASMHLVDTIYLTRIHQDFDGDTTYPTVDEEDFELVEQLYQGGEIPYTFMTYKRRR